MRHRPGAARRHPQVPLRAASVAPAHGQARAEPGGALAHAGHAPVSGNLSIGRHHGRQALAIIAHEQFNAAARIAHRHIDHLRARRPQASLDAPVGEGDATLADTLAAPSGFGPLRRIETRQQAAQLLAALAELPPEQREAFLLQAEAEMSVSDIAVTTGVGFETAKSRLRYARAALRRALENL